MRVIRFRGYNKNTKRWYYGSYARLERTTPYPMSQDPEGDAKKFEDEQVDHYIFFTEDNDWGLETRKLKATVDPLSVGQSLNKYDSRNQEIYEGDIVETEQCEKPATIEWHDDLLEYVLTVYHKEDDYFDSEFIDPDVPITVISNTYEEEHINNEL